MASWTSLVLGKNGVGARSASVGDQLSQTHAFSRMLTTALFPNPATLHAIPTSAPT